MTAAFLRRVCAQCSVAVVLSLLAVFCAPADAQTQPAPGAHASPAASPQATSSPPAAGATPKPQASTTPQPSGTLHVGLDAHATFISQGTRGPGTLPPEGPAFALGSPAAPLSPYDTFSSAPMTPGNAGESAFTLIPSYATRALTISARLGAGLVAGSSTNASYWGESLEPALNPHLGSQVIPYAVVFPQHAGADDAHGFVASALGAEVATRNGRLRLRGGWFDVQQSDAFVFTAPAFTSFAPQLAVLPAESAGNGSPSADFWSLANPQYPLHGIDLVATSGIATAELTDATLPSLPGTSARLTMASLVFDRGEGTRLSAQFAHVSTGGALVPTTILFASGTLVDSPQGFLPIGSIGGQQQSIAGLRAAFHVFQRFDGLIEYGHSTYDADHVSLPGSQRPGNYYHAGIARTFDRLSGAFDYYANDPYYATAILPYGVPENVWAVAWSWPGQWLKSNYQLINNFPVNVDRQGYRAKVQYDGAAVAVHLSYANFGQIAPITIDNASRTGFVDGFFLPQANDAATFGRQNQYAAWMQWHAPFADLVADWTLDAIRRPALAGHPRDTVDYHTPEYSLYATRRVNKNVFVSLGYAQYAMNGSFGQAYENIDFVQRIGSAGVQFRETQHTATLLSLRRSAFAGYAVGIGNPVADFSGTLVVLEQRLRW